MFDPLYDIFYTTYTFQKKLKKAYLIERRRKLIHLPDICSTDSLPLITHSNINPHR